MLILAETPYRGHYEKIIKLSEVNTNSKTETKWGNLGLLNLTSQTQISVELLSNLPFLSELMSRVTLAASRKWAAQSFSAIFFFKET